jgi:hypothetical protein
MIYFVVWGNHYKMMLSLISTKGKRERVLNLNSKQSSTRVLISKSIASSERVTPSDCVSSSSGQLSSPQRLSSTGPFHTTSFLPDRGLMARRFPREMPSVARINHRRSSSIGTSVQKIPGTAPESSPMERIDCCFVRGILDIEKKSKR